MVTAVAAAAKRGGLIVMLSELLGHESLDTTAIYVRSSAKETGCATQDRGRSVAAQFLLLQVATDRPPRRGGIATRALSCARRDSNMNLLLVDDYELLGVAIVRLASAVGLDAVHVASAELALELLAYCQSQLVIIVDVHPMRPGAALRFLEELRHRDDQRPVVLMSALALDERDPTLRRVDVAGFLVKPFGARRLAEVYQAAIARRAQKTWISS